MRPSASHCTGKLRGSYSKAMREKSSKLAKGRSLWWAKFLHQRLFHGGESHVQIELRQIEIGRERFGNASLRIPLYRKIARLVLPGDAVEIQQVGEDLLALVGEVLAGQPHHAGRHDAMPCQAQADLKLD